MALGEGPVSAAARWSGAIGALAATIVFGAIGVATPVDGINEGNGLGHGALGRVTAHDVP